MVKKLFLFDIGEIMIPSAIASENIAVCSSAVLETRPTYIFKSMKKIFDLSQEV